MAAVTGSQLREGMEVHSGEGQSLGTIERINRDSITVRGQQYEFTSIERVEGNRVHLTRRVGASVDTDQRSGPAGRSDRVVEAQGELRVPEVEERLDVEKRPVELGEVRIDKRVTEAEQTVSVELAHEEVRVEQRATEARPATEADLRGAFQEGTIRVPVRGEEAVVSKQAVVTGEVVVNKERTTEREEVSETVRRTHVEVDDDQRREGDRPQTQPQTGARAAPTTGAAAAGGAVGAVGAGAPARGQITEGLEVVSADGERLGRVKELREEDFLLDRSGQRDLYVPLGAVAQVTGTQLTLSTRADEVDGMNWPKPSLL